MKLNKYQKYDAYVLERARNIRQNLWTMEYRSQCPTNSFEVIDRVRLKKYPKYDAFLFDMVGNTGQNHWTMKYRSQ